jgi:N-acetylmuramic acid 6-phosphate etherase
MQSALLTEARNPHSASIDSLSTEDMLSVMNSADEEIANSVKREIANIARAIDAIVPKLQAGGRLFYTGAGTSGRLGVLDASECPPTFNTPPELVQALIAGGDRALRNSVENAEDNVEQGKFDLQDRGFAAGDVLVGIAASGRTPYVLGALTYARSIGALTVGVSCTPGSQVAAAANVAITPAPGPEVITGSTRLRAGTATKLVLNMLSTGVMVKLGYVYGNLMVNVQPTNEKLRDRARRMIAELASVPSEEAAELLSKAGSVKTAVVMKRFGLTRQEAEERLRSASGRLRAVLEAAPANEKSATFDR